MLQLTTARTLRRAALGAHCAEARTVRQARAAAARLLPCGVERAISPRA